MIVPQPARLDVEYWAKPVGRVHGAKDNSYTAGVVICAQGRRYAERVAPPRPVAEAGWFRCGARRGA